MLAILLYVLPGHKWLARVVIFYRFLVKVLFAEVVPGLSEPARVSEATMD
jgi:hypothetical protein